MTDAVHEWVDAHLEEFLHDPATGLIPWLRIPSVSADPARAGDVEASAQWLAEALTAAGFPTVEIWPTAGAPTVYAHWPAADPDARRVVVYGHHDVQPVDPEELWDSPPFDPVIRGDELHGRGASDDKGQVAAYLFGVRALLAATGATAPPVHLSFVIEGEEESGSPNFRELLEARRDTLAADIVLVGDTGMWSRDVPTICTGMRGLVDAQITLTGPTGDLHSGSFGGGVPNPLHALAELLAGLHDADGRITVAGFYDDVRSLTDRERELFAALPYDEAEWLDTAQSTASYGEAGFSTLERIWARPTCEVNGMWGGYTGPGHKTIIPSAAHAKLSMRIVADQEPEKVFAAFRQHVEDHTPAGLTATVSSIGGGVRPCLTPLDTPALQAATRGMATAFGGQVLYTREGGSGPEADLADVLGAPVVFVGTATPSDRIHAPNERMAIPLLALGAVTVAHVLTEFAAMTG